MYQLPHGDVGLDYWCLVEGCTKTSLLFVETILVTTICDKCLTKTAVSTMSVVSGLVGL